MSTEGVAERIQEIMRQMSGSSWHGDGYTQVDGSTRMLALAEEGARLSDSVGDEAHAFFFRVRLAAMATNLNLPEQALVAVSWCLAAIDRGAPRLPVNTEQLAVIQASHVLQWLPEIPDISRRAIDQLMADVERRFQRAGLPRRRLWEDRQYILTCLGDLDAAGEAFAGWRSMPREGSRYECDTCEAAAVMEWFLALDRDEDALAAAAQVLDGTAAMGADEGCAAMRAWIFTYALAPLLRLGRVDEAVVLHPRGLRPMQGDTFELNGIGQHLVFLAATGATEQALPLVEQHLRLAEKITEHGRYWLDAAVWLVVEALVRRGVPQVVLRLPEWHHAYQPSGRYDTAVLAERLAAPVLAMTARFDARNGNDFVSTRLARQRALLDMPGL